MLLLLPIFSFKKKNKKKKSKKYKDRQRVALKMITDAARENCTLSTDCCCLPALS